MLTLLLFIRLDGEKSDWEKLQKKSRDLIQLLPGLEFWLKTLDEITQQFVDAFDDKIDKDFWNSLYKGKLSGHVIIKLIKIFIK